MNATTKCPTCNTRFKVTPAQIDAHQGLVRCGCCQAVFNAKEYLQGEQTNPQLDPPVDNETALKSAGESPHEKLDHIPISQDNELQLAELHNEIELDESIPLSQTVSVVEIPAARPPTPIKKNRVWPWAIGSVLLMVLLLAQAAYFFRVEISANQPALKPALISYCRLLQCTVPMPHRADLMSIESSDLEADPAQISVIALNALLRNHAPYTQAYPDLELTLTDAQDNPLARRTFHPTEYLKSGEAEKQGLAANRELGIKLNLDTADLKPSGYRLFLFYPL